MKRLRIGLYLGVLGIWASSPAADFHEMSARPGWFGAWMAAGIALLACSAIVVAIASYKLELMSHRTVGLVIGVLAAALAAESLGVLALLDGDTFKYVYFREQCGVVAAACFAFAAACFTRAYAAVKHRTPRRTLFDVLEVFGWFCLCVLLVYALSVLRRSNIPDGLFRVARIGESVFIYGAPTCIVAVYVLGRVHGLFRAQNSRVPGSVGSSIDR